MKKIFMVLLALLSLTSGCTTKINTKNLKRLKRLDSLKQFDRTVKLQNYIKGTTLLFAGLKLACPRVPLSQEGLTAIKNATDINYLDFRFSTKPTWNEVTTGLHKKWGLPDMLKILSAGIPKMCKMHAMGYQENTNIPFDKYRKYSKKKDYWNAPGFTEKYYVKMRTHLLTKLKIKLPKKGTASFHSNASSPSEYARIIHTYSYMANNQDSTCLQLESRLKQFRLTKNRIFYFLKTKMKESKECIKNIIRGKQCAKSSIKKDDVVELIEFINDFKITDCQNTLNRHAQLLRKFIPILEYYSKRLSK